MRFSGSFDKLSSIDFADSAKNRILQTVSDTQESNAFALLSVVLSQHIRNLHGLCRT